MTSLDGEKVYRVCENGDKLRLQALFNKFGAAVVVKATDSDKETGLHGAAHKGQASMASLLLEKGAAVDARNEWHSTPLHEAARPGHWGVASLLLEGGADLEATDVNKETPLRGAIRCKKLEFAKNLMEAGASLQKARQSNYWKKDFQNNLVEFWKTYDVDELEQEALQPAGEGHKQKTVLKNLCNDVNTRRELVSQIGRGAPY